MLNTKKVEIYINREKAHEFVKENIYEVAVLIDGVMTVIR